MISKPKAKPPSTKSSAKVRQSAPKLASGTTARAVKEWIGKSPDDWPPPPRVQLRLLERQHGKCAITGRKFQVGDEKRMDHKTPQADGGVNRESNLQWILDDAAHKPKSKAEAKVRKRVRKRAKTHAGLKAPPKRPLESRNDLQAAKPDKDRLPVPSHLPTELERRYGIVAKPRRR